MTAIEIFAAVLIGAVAVLGWEVVTLRRSLRAILQIVQSMSAPQASDQEAAKRGAVAPGLPRTAAIPPPPLGKTIRAHADKASTVDKSLAKTWPADY